MRYRIIAVVEAATTVTVGNDALASAIVGAFEPPATEVVMVDVHQWDMAHDVMERLRQLAQWHRDMAKHPVDVSGSDHVRAERKRFHEQAWYDIRAALGDEDVTRAITPSTKDIEERLRQLHKMGR